MGKVWKYTRRGFLGLGVLAAGGVAFGYYKYKQPYANPLEAMLGEGEATFNPYITINSDGTITIIAPRAEMGQGIHTTLAALVAEELGVTLDQVTVVHGPASEAYYNEAMLKMAGPFPYFEDGFMANTVRGGMGAVSKFLGLQVTGGSSATLDGFVKMRTAGAVARQMLVAAAANRWGVAPESLKVDAGTVTGPNGSLTFGELALAAAEVEPPSTVALKPQKDWKILGKSQNRVEGTEKVTGGRIFGIDVQLPDMLYGTVKMSPRFGVGAKSYDPAPTLAVNGVRDVVEIETTTGKGFGIIADNTWAAFQGAAALVVDWETAKSPSDEAELAQAYDAALASEPSWTSGGTGDAIGGIAAADPEFLLTSRYDVPFLAHAAMEPMNATAQFTDGKLEIWCGTQAPGILEIAAANLLDIETTDVTVNTTRLGGGFGRRGEVDFGLYATAMAMKTGGKPIKVTWTREEDMAHDTYRPRVSGVLQAVVKPGQVPETLDFRVAAPSTLKSLMGRTFPSLPMAGPDDTVLDGAFNQPIAYTNSRYAAHIVETNIPTGFWRSVGNSQNAWFHECFLDEVAEKSGLDPVEMRLKMMAGQTFSPAHAALTKVAEMSNWGAPVPAGKGKGVAFAMSFGTWVAQVVQVAVTDGGIRIENVWCAADPGTVLDPKNFEAQMMSGIIFGLSQALGQEITMADGQVEQENFYDFDAMRMWQTPSIDIAILQNAPKMGGAGEPGTPPAAPALTNAIYAATGQRIRQMPLSHSVDFI